MKTKIERKQYFVNVDVGKDIYEALNSYIDSCPERPNRSTIVRKALVEHLESKKNY